MLSSSPNSFPGLSFILTLVLGTPKYSFNYSLSFATVSTTAYHPSSGAVRWCSLVVESHQFMIRSPFSSDLVVLSSGGHIGSQHRTFRCPLRLSSDFWRRFFFQVVIRCYEQCLQRTGTLPCRCPWEGFTHSSLVLLPPKLRGNFSWIFTMNPGGPPESLKCKCPFKAANSPSHQNPAYIQYPEGHQHGL